MCPMNPRLLRPTPTGFDPRRIAGLVAWYDAADASSVTLDSGRVSTWRDKSSSARNATNSTSGSTQPEYVLAGQNGKNVLRFVAADATALTLSGFTLIDTFTSFTVLFRSATGANAAGLNGTAQGAGGDRYPFMIIDQFSIITHRSNSTAATSVLSGNPTGGLLFTVRRTFSTELLMRRNGGTQTNTLTTGGNVTTAAANTYNRIGSAASAVSQDLAEILHYSESLSLTQIAAVERYLAGKWGLTIT
jgi:hypothetical protein